MHPRNRYAENPPDFSALAQLYPSFKPYVTINSNGRAKIDWTDYNATRELTRVLLEHDHGVKWWIPDGQLCPTVPNRSNYIHWIRDLLSSCPAPWRKDEERDVIVGLDIGTGANCIYPLLGASLHGWRFLGTDFTPVALEWAAYNVSENPHLADLIEIRKTGLPQVGVEQAQRGHLEESARKDNAEIENSRLAKVIEIRKAGPDLFQESLTVEKQGEETDQSQRLNVQEENFRFENLIDIKKAGLYQSQDFAKEWSQGLDQPEKYAKQEEELKSIPILVGVVKDDEHFDFSMCNPPFFDSIEDAGANPRTACGGTADEMVCVGGEKAFISRMVDDSAKLRNKIHWFTTMAGKKATMKDVISKLRKIGVTMLKTTEFVQGRTSRWGIAWSFSAPHKVVLKHVLAKKISFMLEGLGKQHSPAEVLKALAVHLESKGATCKVDVASFTVTGILPDESSDVSHKRGRDMADVKAKIVSGTQFKASVFQQAPGSLLVMASLQEAENVSSDLFSSLFGYAKEALKEQFLSRVKQRLH